MLIVELIYKFNTYYRSEIFNTCFKQLGEGGSRGKQSCPKNLFFNKKPITFLNQQLLKRLVQIKINIRLNKVIFLESLSFPFSKKLMIYFELKRRWSLRGPVRDHEETDLGCTYWETDKCRRGFFVMTRYSLDRHIDIKRWRNLKRNVFHFRCVFGTLTAMSKSGNMFIPFLSESPRILTKRTGVPTKGPK